MRLIGTRLVGGVVATLLLAAAAPAAALADTPAPNAQWAFDGNVVTATWDGGGMYELQCIDGSFNVNQGDHFASSPATLDVSGQYSTGDQFGCVLYDYTGGFEQSATAAVISEAQFVSGTSGVAAANPNGSLAALGAGGGGGGTVDIASTGTAAAFLNNLHDDIFVVVGAVLGAALIPLVVRWFTGGRD